MVKETKGGDNTENSERVKKQLFLKVLYCKHNKKEVCKKCIKKIFGNVNEISGDVSGISGNVSGIFGDVSGISGDVSEISGNVSGIFGDVKELISILLSK